MTYPGAIIGLLYNPVNPEITPSSSQTLAEYYK